jgi:hypothetical protein
MEARSLKLFKVLTESLLKVSAAIITMPVIDTIFEIWEAVI